MSELKVVGDPMLAIPVTCPYCLSMFHAIVKMNPSYDTCPKCNKEIRFSLRLEIKKAEEL